jgi:hypothetical protein
MTTALVIAVETLMADLDAEEFVQWPELRMLLEHVVAALRNRDALRSALRNWQKFDMSLGARQNAAIKALAESEAIDRAVEQV